MVGNKKRRNEVIGNKVIGKPFSLTPLHFHNEDSDIERFTPSPALNDRGYYPLR